MHLLSSCEHAHNSLPKEYASRMPASILASHRGWDLGALSVAKHLAQALRAPLIAGKFSRLLVDLNRSANNPKAFSAWINTEEKKIFVMYSNDK